MAGRGTDIQLGGNFDAEVADLVAAGETVDDARRAQLRQAWKSRHEVEKPMESRLQRPDPRAPEAVTAEMAARRVALDLLRVEVPGLLQAMIIDLLTGVVLGRVGRSAAASSRPSPASNPRSG
jgi:preprotein translocase subunit SecA